MLQAGSLVPAKMRRGHGRIEQMGQDESRQQRIKTGSLLFSGQMFGSVLYKGTRIS